MELPPMRMYVSVKYFVVHWEEKGLYLVLERSTHRIYSTSEFTFSDKGMSPSDIFFLDIYFVLGVIPIETVLYIAVVTKAEHKGKILGEPVYEIKAAELIEFNRSEQSPNLDSFKASVLNLLSSGFFFSYSYRLTLSIGALGSTSSLHEQSNKNFYWNIELYKEFLDQEINKIWLIPIIQGFFSIYKNNKNTLALISRRSCERAGTRYNCRGIDENGNVANFVETEQILIVNQKIFSYLQIRGSVPVFWEQTGVTAQLSFTKSREMSVLAFDLHASKMIESYNHVTMINLLSSSKTHEACLTEEWETVFNKVYAKYSQNVAYTYFDFHASCKGQKYHKVSVLLDNLSDFMEYYSYYSSDGKVQQGVIRTNCLDCLDRTNVVQSFIAWDVLIAQLRTLNLDYSFKQDQKFVQAFKSQWADNGDYLSIQYTGTGSTISAITRSGTMGLRGLIAQGITSINRFYYANVQDDIKQVSIEAILRKKNKNQIVNKVKEELKKRSHEYIDFVDVKINVVTWNLSGNPLESIKDLVKSDDFCDIVVFSFQQIKDFEASEEELCKAMAGYTKLACQAQGEYVLVVFIENSLSNHVSCIDFDVLSLPFRLKPSQKLAIVLTFSLFDSSFCLISCHLVSGIDNNCVRKDQIDYIHSQAFGKTKKLLKDFDAKLLFGNLNFRINYNSFQVLSYLENANYEELLKAEQLTQNLKNGYLLGYKESSITFPPNFPYVPKTNEYDAMNKRNPSWCDRILYNGSLDPFYYSDINIHSTSHKPVQAKFLLKVKKINKNLKKITEEKLFAELTPMPLGTLPKMNCAKDLLSCN